MNKHRIFMSASYPISKLLHLLLVCGADCTLVITEDGDLSVAIVVELDLLDNSTT